MTRPAELVRRLAHPSRGASRRLRTTLLLGVVLAMTAVVVPPASVRESPTSLMAPSRTPLASRRSCVLHPSEHA